ncbi:hypothetical protein DLH72_02720 [Candidatus Gracilibacteria bacterium]|nr:MAG: hypothetical protein DLH72_02720 [Candidatus Gracilibacteria bacterium]
MLGKSIYKFLSFMKDKIISLYNIALNEEETREKVSKEAEKLLKNLEKNNSFNIDFFESLMFLKMYSNKSFGDNKNYFYSKQNLLEELDKIKNI